MPGVYYYQLDVTDFAAIESTAETIRREHGDPTVLINNAGVGEHNLLSSGVRTPGKLPG